MIDTSEWRNGLPSLMGPRVTVRELCPEDAGSLHAALTAPDVSRFVPPPPSTTAGFEQFIKRGLQERAAGRAAIFGVQLVGESDAVGLVAFRAPTEPQLPWHWGFIFGRRTWGTGIFQEAAQLCLSFAFGTLQLRIVEAWCSLANGRANGALAKLGATPELRRQACAPDGRFGDFLVWSVRPRNGVASPD
jgi:RimJ/RimL family protein N-acetyltransferase